ncbi:hypothetical protein BH11ACT5_BH11ACT5_06580 [soil metagenome]
MNDTTTPARIGDYLNALDRALNTVTPAVRATILEDVRGHIADAFDGGQAVAAVLEGLGSPEEMASSAVAELDLAPPTAAAKGTDSPRRLLLLTATAVAVVTAAVLSFALPHRSTTTEFADGSTLVEPVGLGLVLITLVPAIAAVLPLLLPMRMRAGVTLTAAIAGTVLTAVTLSHIGSLYLPLIFLLWAAVIVPWLRGRGKGTLTRIASRIAFTIAMIVPPVLVSTSLINRSFEISWIIWAGALLSVLLVGLFAGGVRAAYVLSAALGGGLMIYALIEFGSLFTETWTAGGLYLTIGLSAILTTVKR